MKKRNHGMPVIFKLAFLSLIIQVLGGCSIKSSEESDSTDQSDDPALITRHSNLLSIFQREGYEEAVVKNPKGETVARYIIPEKGHKISGQFPSDAMVLPNQLNSIVIDSEVYGGVMEELGELDRIKGVFDPDFVTLPSLKERISSEKVSGLGQTSSPNIEKILQLSPDGMMISYFEGMQTQGLEKTSVPIIKMYDIQENTPLGRAEWIKFIGRLVGKGELADSIFNSVEKNYNLLKEKGKQIKNNPKILTENVYNGTWFVPGGKSYQAALIMDAGGRYPWNSDESTGSLSLSVEQVLEKAHDADIWLVKSFGKELTKEELLKMDSRYNEFQPLQTGNVYLTNTSASGYFTEFPFHPELLLRDYITIFTGDTEQPLRYYQKIR